ncbi:hypothetical protein BDZ90DRAFT_117442 [Jaminaea rosea]|uniref:A to I editase domain-containing protein n=1 Tax=Jaminaea rosea TaxID=1569628 RepID=A0A316UWL2_9BASI|nr:hypothetical protein BDZ90DRAFT_117442 [Jaminaea rosea]PWN29686.1 hypothetical protein BDZ90DRAFT_117442 [Jaminaea rosea]
MTARDGSDVTADQVVEAVFSRYRASLARSHRLQSSSSSSATGQVIEWTILAAVCLVSPSGVIKATPIALGTGTKTLPFSKLRHPALGDVLHDCHAEVMARRAARTWLAKRIAAESTARKLSLTEIDGLPLLLQRDEQTGRVGLRKDVECWWYVSTLPCGECSSPSLMRRRQEQDKLAVAATAECQDTAAVVSPDASAGSSLSVVRGRHNLLADNTAPPELRTVPGRWDSLPSISHSCTDKLLFWSQVGWQGAALSHWIDPIGIDALVVSSPVRDHQDLIAAEVQRGLDVRLRMSACQAESVDVKPPPVVIISDRLFDHSQEVLAPLYPPTTDLIPSWTSSSWIMPSATDGRAKDIEIVVGGIKQGGSLRRSPSDGPLREKARSRLCKLDYLMLLERCGLVDTNLERQTYAAVKGKELEALEGAGVVAYRERKCRMRGSDGEGAAAWDRVEAWLRAHQQQEEASDGEKAGDAQHSTDAAPLAGWLITPTDVERFTAASQKANGKAASQKANGNKKVG